MAKFHCRLMADDGRIIEEVFQADSKADLLVAFKSRGYRPIQITERKQTLASKSLGSNKLKLKSLILFCRQMSTLLRSGVPLVKCFEIIASQTDDKLLKKAMEELSGEVQSGAVLSAAMAKQGSRFPDMLIKMLEVGEVTGNITTVLERMASQYENDNRINRKVRGAMTYPLVLVGIALVACVFMLIAIVPRFVDVFESLNTELPLLTRILLAVSDFIIHRWYVLILVIPVIFCGLIRFFKLPKVRRWLDIQKLSLGLLRVPMQKIMCTQLARTLHTLISSGVPIVQAMGYMNRNIRNVYANECIDSVIIGLRAGKGIAVQLGEYPIFPKLLVSMISIGEASGNLEDMLSKTADYFDEEMDAAISQITGLLEPLMILLVGILIGGIVMALYAPMFGVISAMSGNL